MERSQRVSCSVHCAGLGPIPLIRRQVEVTCRSEDPWKGAHGACTSRQYVPSPYPKPGELQVPQAWLAEGRICCQLWRAAVYEDDEQTLEGREALVAEELSPERFWLTTQPPLQQV